MSNAQEIAEHYFELSNQSDFDEISKLMTPHTTYTSATTGMYLGRDEILMMQRAFHGGFDRLHWSVNSVTEEKPGIVVFDYSFDATRPNGESVHGAGIEYVLVAEGRIQHIEIRNK